MCEYAVVFGCILKPTVQPWFVEGKASIDLCQGTHFKPSLFTVFGQCPSCVGFCLPFQLRKGRAQGISAADGVTEDACPWMDVFDAMYTWLHMYVESWGLDLLMYYHYFAYTLIIIIVKLDLLTYHNFIVFWFWRYIIYTYHVINEHNLISCHLMFLGLRTCFPHPSIAEKQ